MSKPARILHPQRPIWAGPLAQARPRDAVTSRERALAALTRERVNQPENDSPAAPNPTAETCVRNASALSRLRSTSAAVVTDGRPTSEHSAEALSRLMPPRRARGQ